MDRSSADRWLGWLILPVLAALILSALTLGRQAFTGVTVDTDGVVSAVQSGSPGDLAGLRRGDHIREPEHRVQGPSLEPNPLANADPGSPVLVLRDRDGRTRPVWIAPAPLPDRERRFFGMLLVVASGFLLLGGWVWSERRDRLTRTFLVLCLAFSVTLAPRPRLHAPDTMFAWELAFLAAQLVLPVVFAHFFALFPEAGRRTRHRLWVRIGYGIAAALWLLGLGVAIEHRVGAGVLAPALTLVRAGAVVLFAAGVLGGLVLFARTFARARSTDARRRLRVAFLGTLLGAAPIALAILWRNLSRGGPLPGERLTVLVPLFVPASFAWAIAVHRVFDFRVALRAAVVLALAAVAALLSYAGGEWLAATWWPELGTGVSGAALAFLALVAAVAGPARPLLARMGARMVPIAGEAPLATWMPETIEAREGDVRALLQEACESVMHALRLDGCSAVRTSEMPPRLVCFTGARLMPALGPGLLEAVRRADGPVDVTTLDLAGEDRDTLELAGVHWLLPVPGAPVAAVLLLGRRLAGPWLDRGEVRDLERFARHLAVALENADLRREARHRVALDRELEEAHHVQLHRLPRRTPVYPTLDCAAVTLSSESVGGDYYDFVETGPREFALAVGDAAGHGVPAALVLAGVQSRFRDEAQRARHPGDLLEALNRDLVAVQQPEKFVGMLCARVDVASGVIRFANAGLTPPVVRRADGRLEELRESGTLLGVSENARYGAASVELDAGDVAIVYTDGLTEASRGGRLFGVEGIRDVLDAHAHRRAADLVEELLVAVRQWADEPLDDLTIVVLRQLTQPGSRARPGQRPVKFEPQVAEISP